MTFFDEQKPNKYSALKKLLVPVDLPYEFRRMGKGDGSYVIPKEITSARTLSFGIGDDPEGISFEQEISKLGMVHMYDASIDKIPAPIEGDYTFFKKYVTKDNFTKCVGMFIDFGAFHILKMDIEGHEYDVFDSYENIQLLDLFEVVCFEVHSLIEEIPDGWILEPQLAAAKKDRDKVRRFFENINKSFYLWHIHANNHAPKYVDFPDSLELTYINKRIAPAFDYFLQSKSFPIDGLDEPNYNGRADYVLNWWI